MSESEMVLRVERAIVDELERTKDWRATARAAIEALREPTDTMKDAGLFIGESIEPPPDRVWRAMIDAALAPPTDGAQP